MAGLAWAVLCGAAICYFLIFPLLMLVVGALRSSPYGTEGVWTLAGFATVLSDPRTVPTLLATVFYALVTTAGCMVPGFWFATVAARLATPMRWLITPAMVVLVATPRLYYALSWSMLGNPNSGLFARSLRALGVAQLPDSLTVYSWSGLLIVTILKLVGFAYLLLYGPLSRIDRSLEDAAVMAGVARVRAFFDITLTLLMPALLACFMLIFVEVLQVFDLPAVLGLPAGIHTLPLRVNDYLLETTRPNWVAANALSFFIVLVIAVLLLLQRSILRGKDYVTIGGRTGAGGLAELGRWRWAVDATIVGFVVVAILLPIAQIILGSFQPFFGVYGNWTLVNYQYAWNDEGSFRAMLITLAIAAGGGFVTVSSAFGMAYITQRQPGSPLALLSRVGSWVPACAPGIVLSLALLWSYLNTPLIARLFGTPWLMGFALVVGAIPIAVRAVEGIVAQVGRELEEAARICGAGPLAAVLEVTARLATPSLMAAWFLVGLAISGTLDIPLLLQSINSQTVATMAYSLYTYGRVPQAAALYCLYLVFALVAVAVTVAVFTLLHRGLRRAAVVWQRDVTV
jgi:iron(III) transport system permease protein